MKQTERTKALILLLTVCAAVGLLGLLASRLCADKEPGQPQPVSASSTVSQPLAVREHREGEIVFDITADELAERYNTVCRATGGASFMPSPAGWTVYDCANTPSSPYPSTVRVLMENESILTSPTFTLYQPEDSELVGGLTLDFDDHGYSSELFCLFGEMTVNALCAFIPDMQPEAAAELWRELVALADEHMTEARLGYGVTPPVVYRSGEVGVYSYYPFGDFMHICLFPLTDAEAQRLAEAGTELREPKL